MDFPHKYAAAALCALALFCGVAGCDAASSPAVSVVDTAGLLNASKHAGEAGAHLEKVRAVLQKGLDDVTALYKGKETTPEGQKAILEARAALERQMALERRAVELLLNQAMTKAVEAWHKSHGGTILPRSAVLASDAGADVTKAVLPLLNKQKITYPPLPTVNVRKPEEKKQTAPAKPAHPQPVKKH